VLTLAIPAPGFSREFALGPLEIRWYAITMLLGITAAAWITWRRWKAQGGEADDILELTLWAVGGGLIGARLWHVITSYDQLGDEWYAVFNIRSGGLGIWGGVALGTLAVAWAARRKGLNVGLLANAAAPGLLIGQAIGRLGNYINEELFGGPTDLPWALEVSPRFRPLGYAETAGFHPTFLYEMVWNVALAALLIWIGHRFLMRPWSLFALYVAGYSLGRLFWEQLRIDPSNEFLGQRVNFWVALVLMLAAIAFVIWNQRRPAPGSGAGPGAVSEGGPAAPPGGRRPVKAKGGRVRLATSR
jgi:prolipoprotein diacylglyceryl transferase